MSSQSMEAEQGLRSRLAEVEARMDASSNTEKGLQAELADRLVQLHKSQKEATQLHNQLLGAFQVCSKHVHLSSY